jgi:N-succinyldiaminopimelate aminotransferase
MASAASTGDPGDAGQRLARSAVRFRPDVIDPRAATRRWSSARTPSTRSTKGAAYLAGAEPRFLNTLPGDDYAFDFASLSEAEWQRVQLFFVCSPGNPTGKVLSLDDWQQLFALADRYGFVIASDECYSEIYGDESEPPLGCLQAASLLGRDCAAPGDVLQPVQALQCSRHALGLRRRRRRAAQVLPALPHLSRQRDESGRAGGKRRRLERRGARHREPPPVHGRSSRRSPRAWPKCSTTALPDAGFYLWVRTPISDGEFARGCSPTIMSSSAGQLPGAHAPRGSIPAPVSCASHSSHRSPTASRLPSASIHSFQNSRETDMQAIQQDHR